MKRAILLLVFLMPVAHTLFAESAKIVHYVLTRGNPYSKPYLDAEPVKNVALQFAEPVHASWHLIVEDILWYRCERGAQFFYLPEILVTEAPEKELFDSRGNIPIGSAPVDILHPLSLHYRPTDLVPVLPGYKAQGYEWREMLLRREAAKVFERLIDHAEREGVNIRIISAFRDAEYQAQLYENAIRRNGMLQNSVAKPGHSEHQLGTVCDLTSDEINSGLSTAFENTMAFQWLKHHRVQYGISLTYPKHKIQVTGYIYEPWHYRYMGENMWQRQEYNPFTFYAR